MERHRRQGGARLLLAVAAPLVLAGWAQAQAAAEPSPAGGTGNMAAPPAADTKVDEYHYETAYTFYPGAFDFVPFELPENCTEEEFGVYHYGFPAEGPAEEAAAAAAASPGTTHPCGMLGPPAVSIPMPAPSGTAPSPADAPTPVKAPPPVEAPPPVQAPVPVEATPPVEAPLPSESAANETETVAESVAAAHSTGAVAAVAAAGLAFTALLL